LVLFDQYYILLYFINQISPDWLPGKGRTIIFLRGEAGELVLDNFKREIPAEKENTVMRGEP